MPATISPPQRKCRHTLHALRAQVGLARDMYDISAWPEAAAKAIMPPTQAAFLRGGGRQLSRRQAYPPQAHPQSVCLQQAHPQQAQEEMGGQGVQGGGALGPAPPPHAQPRAQAGQGPGEDAGHKGGTGQGRDPSRLAQGDEDGRGRLPLCTGLQGHAGASAAAQGHPGSSSGDGGGDSGLGLLATAEQGEAIERPLDIQDASSLVGSTRGGLHAPVAPVVCGLVPGFSKGMEQGTEALEALRARLAAMLEVDGLLLK